MTSRCIAVLGAGGFLGSHLVPALADLGHRIDAVDVTFRKLETTSAQVRRIVARVEQPGLAEEITSRCDTVLSLTALCNPALYNTVPLDVIDASFTHLVPWVTQCANRDVRLVHFSTSEVYGRTALDRVGEPAPDMNESDTPFLLGPLSAERWTYACAKQLLERVIWAHGQHHGLSFTIVRLFNVIGPRMDFLPGYDGEGTPRVLASFMNALLRGEDLPLVNGGHQRRTFMSTGDLVDAIVRIVMRPESCHRQVLNLGNPGNDVTIRELAARLASAFAARVPHAPAARMRDVRAEDLYGPGYDDSDARVPDIAKARALLDWEPKESLDQMLPSIVDDYVRRYEAVLTVPNGPALLCGGTR